MNYKKLLYFTLGFTIIFNGLFFIDLASLALKDDLYILGYLGYLNNFYAIWYVLIIIFILVATYGSSKYLSEGF